MRISEKNYVDKAKEVIEQLIENEKGKKKIEIVSITQIRNLLSMSADIYNRVVLLEDDKLPDDIISKIEYLKVRMVYDAGRDDTRKVRKLVETAKLMECINEINESKKNYILFYHYMEALVAYRRFLVEEN